MGGNSEYRQQVSRPPKDLAELKAFVRRMKSLSEILGPTGSTMASGLLSVYHYTSDRVRKAEDRLGRDYEAVSVTASGARNLAVEAAAEAAEASNRAKEASESAKQASISARDAASSASAMAADVREAATKSNEAAKKANAAASSATIASTAVSKILEALTYQVGTGVSARKLLGAETITYIIGKFEDVLIALRETNRRVEALEKSSKDGPKQNTNDGKRLSNIEQRLENLDEESSNTIVAIVDALILHGIDVVIPEFGEPEVQSGSDLDRLEARLSSVENSTKSVLYAIVDACKRNGINLEGGKNE